MAARFRRHKHFGFGVGVFVGATVALAFSRGSSKKQDLADQRKVRSPPSPPLPQVLPAPLPVPAAAPPLQVIPQEAVIAPRAVEAAKDELLPLLPATDDVLVRNKFTVKYDRRTRNAIWVKQVFDKASLQGEALRDNLRFQEDSEVSERFRSRLDDYRYHFTFQNVNSVFYDTI